MPEMVLCACGCGGSRTKYSPKGKILRFISGHQGRSNGFKLHHHTWNKDKTYTIQKIEVYANKGAWCEAVKRTHGDRCMIPECGWNLAACDCHHIKSKSQGGKYTIDNAIILCPNHHRLVEVGLISNEEIKLVKERANDVICFRI